MKLSEVTQEHVQLLVDFLKDLRDENIELAHAGDKHASDYVHAIEYELEGLTHVNEYTQRLTFLRCYEDYDIEV